MLGRAFTENGFCVVRGPDINIDGGDIRDFQPAKNAFAGVIGGSPCQDFSKLNRNPGANSQKMLEQYVRVVNEASPEWFLLENVVHVPEFEISGYKMQRFNLDLAWFSEFSRNRTFVFGSKSGHVLSPKVGVSKSVVGTAVTGSDERPFSQMCEIQGLPSGFDLPFFSLQGKKQAVANGVPLALGNHVAGLINKTVYGAELIEFQQEFERCDCGCGRPVVGRSNYASDACRKRVSRRRLKCQM